MEPTKKVVKLNHLMNFFCQMFFNVNDIFDNIKAGKLEIKKFSKGQSDSFTNYDWIIQKMIENHMEKNFDGIKFIGEEDTSIEFVKPHESEYLKITDIKTEIFKDSDVGECNLDINIDELCIYCDPIDSTSNFIKGKYAPVTCLIGISRKNKPFCGLIHYPYYNGERDPRTYFNIPGKGVYELRVDKDGPKYEQIKFERKKNMNFVITATRENPIMTKGN